MTEAVAQPETFRGLAGRCWLSWSASIAVIAATLAVFSYTLVDQPVAWWAYTHLPPGTRGQHFFDEMTHFGSSGPWLLGAGVAFVICLVLGLRRRAADAALVFAAVAAAGLLVNVVKAILGRARPEALFLHDLYGFEFFHTNYALTGFPSGHSATIGAAATVLTLFWPKLWPVWLIFALVVAGSRAILTAHYVSDVTLGLATGVVITLALNALWMRVVR